MKIEPLKRKGRAITDVYFLSHTNRLRPSAREIARLAIEAVKPAIDRDRGKPVVFPGYLHIDGDLECPKNRFHRCRYGQWIGTTRLHVEQWLL